MSESLRERVLAAATREAVGGLHASPFTLHQKLRRLGDDLLAEAKSAPASRDTALTLLAADALMTFACEAMAQHEPGGLAGGP